jgi:hypothetical protein
MAERRFMVGERVLASRDQLGSSHEEATVYDFYELLIGEEKTPQVVVDFDDGQRVLMTAREPNVRAIEEEEQVTEDFDDYDVADEPLEEGEGGEEGEPDEDDWDPKADE